MNYDDTTGTTRKWKIRIARALLCAGVGGVACCETRAELPREIRVLTYNIRHGEGMDHKIDLPRIAKVIVAAKPDIVALEEVDQGTRRASGVDQPAEFARLTGMNVVFGRNIAYDGGGYGTLYSQPTGPPYRRIGTSGLCSARHIPSRTKPASCFSASYSPPVQPPNETLDACHC